MKLSKIEFTQPKPPRLVSVKEKAEAKGLASVRSSLKQLFTKNTENTRIVSLNSLERVKKSLTQIFRKKPAAALPEKQIQSVENKTEVYSLQPSRRYAESASQTKARANFFTPEYLVREVPKEVFVPLKEEKRRCLLANLNLPLKGILHKRSDGLYYLRITEELFAHIVDLFPCEGCSLPDFDYRLGPAISVILPHENPFGPLFVLGKEFTFFIKRALVVNQYDWPGVEKTVLLTIGSKELSKLRQSHGLSEKLDGRDFHLTIGIQHTAKPFTEKGFMRVHVGYHPV